MRPTNTSTLNHLFYRLSTAKAAVAKAAISLHQTQQKFLAF